MAKSKNEKILYNIDSKGHSGYIRYLLSKRIFPLHINTELKRLALSCNTREAYVVYFEAVILPLAQKHEIDKYYSANYLESLKDSTKKEVVLPLKFKDLDSDEDRIKFIAFIKELDIEDLWAREFINFYGKKIPKDAKGNKLITANPTRSVENILKLPERVYIDKLLIDGFPIVRIPDYMDKKHGVTVERNELYAYNKYFLNLNRRSAEEIFESLLNEKKQLDIDIEVIKESEELESGEKLFVINRLEERLVFLDKTINELNAKYYDFTFAEAKSEGLDLRHIVEDLVGRSYKRYKELDRQSGLEVIKPLTDLNKAILSNIEKIQAIQRSNIESTRKERNVQEVLTELYLRSYTEHISEGEAVDIEDIEGIEDLN